MVYWPAEVITFHGDIEINILIPKLLIQQNPIDHYFKPILLHYIDSTSMLQKFLTAVIAEEWAHQSTELSKTENPFSLVEKYDLAQEFTKRTLVWLQGKPPPAYHEMAFALSRIHTDCISLLQMFATDCKLPSSSIPFLGTDIDISGTVAGCFTIETAHTAVGTMYTRLKDSLGRTRKKELAVIADKRGTILTSIERYTEVKVQHDTRVFRCICRRICCLQEYSRQSQPSGERHHEWY